jgi:DnaK suppressor protein
LIWIKRRGLKVADHRDTDDDSQNIQDLLMKSSLNADKRAALAHVLHARQQALERQITLHRQGQSRVDFARDTLTQDGDDAPQRASDREVDQALSDIDTQALAAVNEAQRRLQSADYGVCVDCHAAIAFARLQVEPDALRCVACQSLRDRSL